MTNYEPIIVKKVVNNSLGMCYEVSFYNYYRLYSGYSKRNAISNFRREFNLVGRRLGVLDLCE
jgi:hypothetical protein